MTHEECKAAILAREAVRAAAHPSTEHELRQQLADVSNERDVWRRRAEWMLRNNGLLDSWATSWVSSGDKPLTQHLSEKVDRALRDEPIDVAQSAPATDEQGAGA